MKRQVPLLFQVVKTAMREISILRKLQFPNIVNLLSVFQDDENKIYLVFEYVGHTVLDELEKNEDGLHSLEVKKLMWQLLRATHFMHNRGVCSLHASSSTETSSLKICSFPQSAFLKFAILAGLATSTLPLSPPTPTTSPHVGIAPLSCSWATRSTASQSMCGLLAVSSLKC